MVAVVSSGTTSALTPGTPSTLDTETSAGVYSSEVDCAALAAGEYLLIEIWVKTLSGGTSRRQDSTLVAWHSLHKTVATVPIPIDVEYKLIVTQIGGSGRTFPWKIWKG